MKEVLGRILEIGIIPVVRVSSPREARDVAMAISAGGIAVIEITLTVPGAIDVIRDLSRDLGGGVTVGAGTVLEPAQAGEALDAGAGFIVSPGICPRVLEFVKKRGGIAIPGALTPSEILEAREEGAELIKVFPVSAVGGPAYIKALRGPFPNIPLVPTGGVGLGNAGEYIRAGASAIGAGGELIDRKALAEKNFGLISETARKFLEEIRKARSPK